MRVLRQAGDSYVFETFVDPPVSEKGTPLYAIFSHRWLPDGEDVLFADVNGSLVNESLQDWTTGSSNEGGLDNQDIPPKPMNEKLQARNPRQKRGWLKLDYAMRQAELDGCEYIWIDTCCIDKSSSADLQEAINSMYEWYKRAKICYAYLWDVVVSPFTTTNNIAEDSTPFPTHELYGREDFTSSVWFTRGWTLQELIAPYAVKFYDREWNYIGARHDDVVQIAERTGIARDLLLGRREPSDYSIAQRMSWAANRTLRRREDEAYCLLGLFDVSIPMLYGEGRKAFRKLQQELLNNTTDQSILAWNRPLGTPVAPGQLPAETPLDFAGCGSIERGSTFLTDRPFRADNRGVTGIFPVFYDNDGRRQVVLNCSRDGYSVALRMATLEPDYDIGSQYSLEGFIKAKNLSNFEVTTDKDCPMAVKHDWKTEYRTLTRPLVQQIGNTRSLILLKSMHEYPFYWGLVKMRALRTDNEEPNRLLLNAIMPKVPLGDPKLLPAWSPRTPVNTSLPQQYNGLLAVTLVVEQSSKTQYKLQIAFVVNHIVVPDDPDDPDELMHFDGAMLISEGWHDEDSFRNPDARRFSDESFLRAIIAVEEAYNQKSSQINLLQSDRLKTGARVNVLEACKVYRQFRSTGLAVSMRVKNGSGERRDRSSEASKGSRKDVRPVVEVQVRFIPPEPDRPKKSLLSRFK